jgi:hypothetical protein
MEVVFKHMGSIFGMDVWDGSKAIKCLQNDTISNTMHLSLSHEQTPKKWVVVKIEMKYVNFDKVHMSI